MKSEDIINKGDAILLDTQSLDRRMYKRLLKYLAEHSLGGKVSITNQDLAQLEDIIYDEVKKSDYEENVSNYLKLLGALENAVSKEQQEINRIKANNIRDLWDNSQTKERLINKIVYDLGQGGVKDYFVKGLAQVVRDANYFNLTFEDAADKLSKVLIDDQYTQRYVQGVAKDSLTQYKGAINDEVRVAYDLNNLLYIGNTIETSRPICAHLRDDLKGKITEKQLRDALDFYCPKGVPSEKIITWTTVSGEKHKGKAGSGMYENTYYDNFAQFRGGHRCRHEAIWVK